MISTIFNILLMTAIVGYSIYLVVRLIRRPSSGCGCGCSGCGMAGSCRGRRQDSKKDLKSQR